MPRSSTRSAERILLIGMMGAGKSTVGRRLAARLGWKYVDSDDQVVAATGRTVRQIFEDDGEAAFRCLESAALVDALAATEPSVVAVAGGAVLDPDNRRRISETRAPVVWLRAPTKVLAERASTGGHRPLLAGGPEQAIEALYPQREPLYRGLATVVVDVEGKQPDEVVAEILEQV